MVPALEEILAGTKNMVFFGGAGVSTESGIPDFRSVDGLYHQKFKYPPETMLSHSFYERHTAEFFDFYRQKLIVHGAVPNAAHRRLAALEREGKCRAVVTQNIDGLHQAAGSRVVYELHGSTLRNYCTRCGKFFPVQFIEAAAGVGDGVPAAMRAAASSSPMSCCTRRDWTRKRWKMPSGRSPVPIPSLWAAPVWRSIRRRGCCGISGVKIWWSSTSSPPRRTVWRIF